MVYKYRLFPADLFDAQLPQVYFDFTDVSAFQVPLLNLLNTLAAKACQGLITMQRASCHLGYHMLRTVRRNTSMQPTKSTILLKHV
jgi:hypothetical protein